MRKPKHSRALKHAGGLATALGCLSAAAQSAPAADAWQCEVIPYLWAAGISSDLRLGPLPQRTTSVSSSSVLSALDFGAMGTLEARKGPWGALLDMQFVKLGVSRQGFLGTPVGVDVDYEQQIYTLAGLYRVYDRSFAIDVLAGGRYVNAKTEVDFAPNLPGPGLRQSVGWWNGIVGARVIAPINDKWSLLGFLDAGWGNSTSSWEAVAGASYQYSPTVSFKFGYRYINFERDEGLLSKVGLGGFFAGAGFKF
jgi:opacity protein-like surface antigen